MSTLQRPLPLFAATGVELEYMIVNARTLNIMPIADQVLLDEAGQCASAVEYGELGWSNELALHVIELKTKEPAPTLIGLAEKAQQDLQQINRRLLPLGACLMPSAVHPWMDPTRETQLWPHEYNTVYETFNRIFGCQGHGWSNLQSQHLNFPFANEDEFARLHAAIRLVLPLLPALAASSPLMEGKPTGYLDNRLRVYRNNCARIPSVTGRVIPEPVFTYQDYETQILQRMYQDIAPWDTEGVLQEEWLNARGAIARFDRNTIEIRVLDIQETPHADLGIAAAVQAVLRALVSECWTDLTFQKSFTTEDLESIFLATVEKAEHAVIRHASYFKAFGIQAKSACSAGEFWHEIITKTMPDFTANNSLSAPKDDLTSLILTASNPAPKQFHGIDSPYSSVNQTSWCECLKTILNEGSLASRILKAVGKDPRREQLRDVYGELCRCLANGNQFRG